jgi:DNA mismatch repair protein MutS
MMRQYLEVKAQQPDALVMYRMGDFFEMFFEDAIRAAPLLEVQLTARHRGTESEVPMCGVPHHALETYLGKLLAAGLKVAICDQIENPAEAKGLVKRAVTRVVTPGTVTDPGLLDGKEDSLLAAIRWNGDGGAGAFLEVSTGNFYVRRWPSVASAMDDLSVFRPREVLFEKGEVPADLLTWLERESPCLTPLEGDRWLDPSRASELLRQQFGAGTLRGFGLVDGEPAVGAAAAALSYARETQRSALGHIGGLVVRESGDRLVLDAASLANLEVLRSQSETREGREGSRRGSLLSVLDTTVTPPGGRTLREWLRRPLADPGPIADRLDAVGELAEDHARRQRIRETLGRLGDPERLAARAVLGMLQPREAAALRDTLLAAPEVLAELSASATPLLRELGQVDPLEALGSELLRTLEAQPASDLESGGVIAAGIDAELDRYRSLAQDSKKHILGLEVRERERTGIGSLKIRYNRVFGYFLEVTHAHQDRVPADYIRKQTLVNAERYVTPEIKELEEQILTAEEKQVALELEHYRRLLTAVAAEAAGLRRLAATIGSVDTLVAFAEAAVRRRYVRPRVLPAGNPILIRDGRHPVVEAVHRDPFVPNDAELDGEHSQITVLTGPNMGGKSTYLRQVALIALMAQAGSHVPAAEASLGVLDRIFTRVGAGDDLARGESTFMSEMIETANIVRHATPRSLVILDEVGRGTATFDGLSLAWALVEHLHEGPRPLTLFATHYHELTELASLLPRVVNRTMAVKEWEEKILFLRRIVPGAADKSYGLHVARLAGLPGSVIDRASEILHNLEAQEYDPNGTPRLARGEGAPQSHQAAQMALFVPPEQVVAGVLREVDIERLTPLAALNLLHSLKSRLG